MGKNIHIVPQKKHWEVKIAGLSSPVSSHLTQATAEKAGRALAKIAQSELITHRPDGRIRSKDSFGPDPNPPKDKEH